MSRCCIIKNGVLNKMKYKIIFNVGKPYEVIVNSEDELKQKLKDFYETYKDNDEYTYYEVNVFNENDDDITESQFIEEIVGEILENE